MQVSRGEKAWKKTPRSWQREDALLVACPCPDVVMLASRICISWKIAKRKLIPYTAQLHTQNSEAGATSRVAQPVPERVGEVKRKLPIYSFPKKVQ